jgi:hypothetical protein
VHHSVAASAVRHWAAASAAHHSVARSSAASAVHNSAVHNSVVHNSAAHHWAAAVVDVHSKRRQRRRIRLSPVVSFLFIHFFIYCNQKISPNPLTQSALFTTNEQLKTTKFSVFIFFTSLSNVINKAAGTSKKMQSVQKHIYKPKKQPLLPFIDPPTILIFVQINPVPLSKWYIFIQTPQMMNISTVFSFFFLFIQ